MKLLLFLLVPVVTFGQSFDYPDTLFLKSGQKLPCYLNSLNSESKYIEIINEENEISIVMINVIDHIYLEKEGIIFSIDRGYTCDLSETNIFLNNRLSNKTENLVKPTYEYPDTLFLKSRQKLPCYLKSLNSENKYIETINEENEISIVMINVIDHIYLEKEGIIFSIDRGYTCDLSETNIFLNNRLSNKTENLETKADVTKNVTIPKDKTPGGKIGFKVFYNHTSTDQPKYSTGMSHRYTDQGPAVPKEINFDNPYHIGGISLQLEYRLGDGCNVSTGLQYLNSINKISFTYEYLHKSTITYEIDYYNLIIPLNLKLYLNEQQKDINFFVSGGIALNIPLDIKSEVTKKYISYTSPQLNNTIKVNNVIEDKSSKFTYCFSTGLSYKKLYMDITYYPKFTKLEESEYKKYGDDSIFSIKNSLLIMGLGIYL